MVSVASLLNPLPFSYERELSKTPVQMTSQQDPSRLQLAGKVRMSKSVATLVKGKPKGEVNYPPYESQGDADADIAAAYEEFEVQPIGHIIDYPKRIPYNSEKRSFQQKTGRDGFEGMGDPPRA